MDVFVCIGSSCHLKGSYDVIQLLNERIRRDSLEGRIEIKGSFCLGRCTDGVCMRVGEQVITGVNRDTFEEKFQTILGALENE
ncbi:MAG: (2Fe-2S) ferredoxin domain-containing protein [Clostridiales bacterium]|nr:(2Fe-2S) ferredoxin domain-containing protein [Clostridiales bacterium]